MFGNLKDKLLTVQQDLSASFRSLATGETSSKGKKESGKGVSYNAGGSLLHYYEKQWEEIHDNDVINAKKAEEVDAKLGKLHSFCFNHLQTARNLNNQLAALPQLHTGILDLMSKIGELEGVFEEVEDALVNLEDVIEIQEIQERMLDHRFQLAMYKEKKKADFDDLKTKMSERHSKRVLEYERKQDVILRERQLTFQEVFEEDLQEYKKHGIKELRRKRISSGNSAGSVSLEEIEIESDTNALNDFLEKDAEKSSAVETGDTGSAIRSQDSAIRSQESAE